MLRLSTPTESSVPAQTPRNVNVVVRDHSDPGVFDMTNGGKVVNIYPVPESVDVSVSSATGANAVATTVYLLNQDTYSNITNNTSGANSITYTYGDGNACKTYNKILATANAGQGMKIYGFNIDFTSIADGSAQPADIATSAVKLLVADGTGGMIPVPIRVQKAQRNTAQDRGLLTVKWEGYINALTQISLVVAVGHTATLSLFTQPID
jgi:hypothetical protein